MGFHPFFWGLSCDVGVRLGGGTQVLVAWQCGTR